MDKFTFLLKALNAGCANTKAWVISAFSVVQEAPDAYKANPYAYRIVQTPTGFFFVEPETKSLAPIEGGVAGHALFDFKERIDLKPGDLGNVKTAVNTTVGNVLVNAILLVYPFGDHYPFITGYVDIGDIEDKIAEEMENSITVQQYIKFTEAAFYLTNFTQIAVWAATPKTIVPPPGINEFRDRLLQENKDKLDDPVVVAGIDKQLVDYYKEYIKGDPGENFLMSKKSIDNVARQLYLMQGVDTKLEEGTRVTPITKSLAEGWDITKFPEMMDGSRAGSYSRGAETMLGGEQVKWLLRTSSNMRITQKDCGSRLGYRMQVTPTTIKQLVGFSIVTQEGYETITSQSQAESYLGQYVARRTPMYCKLSKTDYCEICCGMNLSANPTALSMAVSEYGSVFMTIMMKKMHVSDLSVQKAVIKEIIF